MPVPKGTVIEHDSDGWWAYYPSGWCSWIDPGCHADHEDTKKELMAMARNARPCDCKDCEFDKSSQVNKGA